LLRGWARLGKAQLRKIKLPPAPRRTNSSCGYVQDRSASFIPAVNYALEQSSFAAECRRQATGERFTLPQRLGNALGQRIRESIDANQCDF